MTNEIINPVDYPLWDDLLHTTDRATFFHSSAWARVLSESYGYVPRYFTIIDNRKLAGLIPVMEIDSFLTGKRGVTLPFTDICHPIADTPEIFQVLMERLTQHGKSAGWKHIEIKGGSAFLGKAVPSSAEHITHILELSAAEDTTRRLSGTARNMLIKSLLIFILTYVIISAQKIKWHKLDRPSGTLLGAVLMILTGVLTLDEAYRAVDFNTILLLLGMMIVIGYLKMANCFTYLSYLLVTHARNSFLLLCFVSFSSGILSALFVNDTICLMLTPLLILALSQTKLNPVPYLIAPATSSNIGRVVTLTGNPQNMLIGVFSKIPYLDFTWHLLPIGILSLMANVLIIFILFKKHITRKGWSQLC